MLQRTKFYDVGERAMKLGINISEIVVLSKNAITSLNSVNFKDSLLERAEAIRDSEIKIKVILAKMSSMMNDESNTKIENSEDGIMLHNQMNVYIGTLVKEIEKKRKDVLDIISPYKNLDQEILSNKMIFDEYSSYMGEIISIVVIGSIESAVEYCSDLEELDEESFWYWTFLFFVNALKSVAPISIGELATALGMKREDLSEIFFPRKQEVSGEEPPDKFDDLNFPPEAGRY